MVQPILQGETGAGEGFGQGAALGGGRHRLQGADILG
jgi:hypothetical protein